MHDAFNLWSMGMFSNSGMGAGAGLDNFWKNRMWVWLRWGAMIKKLLKKIIYIFYIFTIKIFFKNTLDSQKKKKKKKEGKKNKKNHKTKKKCPTLSPYHADHALRICHVYPSNHNVSHQSKMTKAATWLWVQLGGPIE